MILIDRYGRPLTHLRITLTHKCNYRCIFCHHEGENKTENELSLDDYRVIAKAVSKIGIKYIKFTGGEPLLRKDLPDILETFAKELKDVELSIVTNGYYLYEKIDKISEYVKRINVSLPSLNRVNYKKITGVDGLHQVLKGLEKIQNYKNIKLKLNVVVTKLNYYDVFDVIQYAQDIGANVNLIELIPLGMTYQLFNQLHVSLDGIERKLQEKSRKITYRNFQNRKVYLLKNIRVEIIKSYGNPYFCKNCTRIRITADGKIKPCLFRNDNLVEMKDVLRSKYSIDEKVKMLVNRFIKANELREPYFKL